ncbi:hypothetical protein [Shewanella sp. Scap07]|uniref:hypothetical protein n=1 Tax=Shewanella sp. Scap07 TaxID=2589987 RepID=UPI0015BD6268|nr:hypothetical protein [Shewanella sp. Scap07]
MSSVIELLEQMGQNAALQNQTSFEQAIEQSDLSDNLKTSLLNRDDISLKRELDVVPDVVCAFLPAEDEKEEKKEKDESPSEKTDVHN